MKDLKKILHFLTPYRGLAFVSLALLTGVVVMDLALPRLIQRLIDAGVRANDMNVVLNTSLWMLGLSLGSLVLAVGNNNFSVQAGEAVARDLREALFVKIQSLSYGDLDRFTTGNLMVRLASDTGAVQRLVQVSLRIGTRAPLLMIGSLILMLRTSAALTLTLVPLLLLAGAAVVFFSVRMEPLFARMQKKLDRLNSVLQENIAGARLVKAFVRADYEAGRFENANEDLTRQTEAVIQLMSAMAPVLTLSISAGIALVIWSGGLQVIAGEMTTGQIVAFTNYLFTTMVPLVMSTLLANVWANGLASARRINEVLDTVPEVRDGADARSLAEIAVAPEAQGLRFENVTFSYNAERPVLQGIDLGVRRGETLAVLGATGAGKSSLVSLIPRFYDVDGGALTLNGADVRALTQDSILAEVAIVPQETILFSGSVAENIRYGRPEAAMDEVLAAAQAAQAHDFIQALPHGYETQVAERGVNLSGGQKQRIAIARALLMRTEILILDDATSAVDVETEAKIYAALKGTLDERACIIVAQRISTALNADRIVVLDDGRIVAEGSHRQLMESSRVYQEIYASQLGGGVSA